MQKKKRSEKEIVKLPLQALQIHTNKKSLTICKNKFKY